MAQDYGFMLNKTYSANSTFLPGWIKKQGTWVENKGPSRAVPKGTRVKFKTIKEIKRENMLIFVVDDNFHFALSEEDARKLLAN